MLSVTVYKPVPFPTVQNCSNSNQMVCEANVTGLSYYNAHCWIFCSLKEEQGKLYRYLSDKKKSKKNPNKTMTNTDKQRDHAEHADLYLVVIGHLATCIWYSFLLSRVRHKSQQEKIKGRVGMKTMFFGVAHTLAHTQHKVQIGDSVMHDPAKKAHWLGVISIFASTTTTLNACVCACVSDPDLPLSPVLIDADT